MTINEFPTHTVESAPEASKKALEHAAKSFGAIPTPLGRMAESPAAVAAFHDGLTHFARSSLTPIEREVVTFVVATKNECHYCVAMHTPMAAKLGLSPSDVETLRSSRVLADARLEALRQFTLAVLARRGDVADAELAAFLAAGFSHRAALDVVVGIATYTLSTLANRLTRAPLDAALEPFRWETTAT